MVTVAVGRGFILKLIRAILANVPSNTIDSIIINRKGTQKYIRKLSNAIPSFNGTKANYLNQCTKIK